MEKNVQIGILLDIYGKLLTEKQRQLLEDYYNNDLSLSEIAENENITRQAVRDNLKKGENNLFEYEEKLEIMKKNKIKEEIVKDIENEICKVEKKEISSIQKNIKKIKDKLNLL